MPAKTALFGNNNLPVDETGSDKLHDLYWNRAQLKQAYAKLSDETFRLKKFIKEQEGATARVQQKLDHLENLLLDPEWVNNVIVFYQLKGLNARCCSKVARFAEQLKQQREKRMHSQELVGWNESRKQEAVRVEKSIGEQRMQLQLLEDQLLAEQNRVRSMNGLSKMLKGRQAHASLDELSAQIETAGQREEELLAELDEIQTRTPPPVPGLDIAAKRSINFMILAFAQDLYLRFEDRNFAAMVKESQEKSVGSINYGNKEDCDRLIRKIVDQGARLDEPVDLADVLKLRAARIAEHADFGGADDAVPAPGTVATIYAFDSAGSVRTADGNLLGEDYWQVSRVLAR